MILCSRKGSSHSGNDKCDFLEYFVSLTKTVRNARCHLIIILISSFYLGSSAMIVDSSYHHHHNERMKVHLADNRYYTSQNTFSQTELEIDPYKGLITLHC